MDNHASNDQSPSHLHPDPESRGSWLATSLRIIQWILLTVGFQCAVRADWALIERTLAPGGWALQYAISLAAFAAALFLASRILAFCPRSFWPSASWRAAIVGKLLYVNAVHTLTLAPAELLTHGPTPLFGWAAAAAVISIIVALVAGRAIAMAKQKRRNTFALRIAKGQIITDFVLFLRPFSQERLVRISERASWLEMLARSADPVSFGLGQDEYLETSLASAFDGIPTLALGWHEDYVGAGRIETTDNNWDKAFQDLAQRAKRIVFFPHTSKGTMQELSFLASAAALLDKTTFVCPPCQAFDDQWSRTRAAAEAFGLQFPPFKSQGLMFRFKSGAGSACERWPMEHWSASEIRKLVLGSSPLVWNVPKSVAITQYMRTSRFGATSQEPGDSTKWELPLVDQKWEHLLTSRISGDLCRVLGPNPDPSERNPLHFVRLAVVGRLVTSATFLVLLSKLPFLSATGLAFTEISIWLAVPIVLSVWLTTLGLCSALRDRSLQGIIEWWENRAHLIACRETVDAVVRSGLWSGFTTIALVIASKLAWAGVLWLAYLRWGWTGAVANFVLLFLFTPPWKHDMLTRFQRIAPDYTASVCDSPAPEASHSDRETERCESATPQYRDEGSGI